MQTACNAAQDMYFSSSVASFIFHVVKLVGINSVMHLHAVRDAVWACFAEDLDTAQPERMTREVGLVDPEALGSEMMACQVRKRVVVNVNR